MKRTMPLTLLFFILIFSGCHLGPTYKPPIVLIPDEWKNASYAIDGPIVDLWWEAFEDEYLNELMQLAILNNYDLYSSLQRIAEARAIAGVERADLFPQATLNPSYSSTGTLIKLYGISALPLPPGTTINPIVRVHEMQYTFPLNLSYELDLWGKIRGEWESAVYNAQAKEEAFRAILLSLTSDLASFYFNTRALDADIQMIQQTIVSRKKSYDLVKNRRTAGISNELDLARAELQLSNAEAELEDANRQRRLFENAIATLIGIPASQFYMPKNPLVVDPPLIPAGLPSAILLRRPDIAEAERMMASEHALIGVAYASFYPSLTLTGALGFASPDLKNFFSWKSRYWMVGANIAQTVFDGWRNQSLVNLTYARYNQAVGNYQKTVIRAFQEVEDALNNIEQQANQTTYLIMSVQAATKALTISNSRYVHGLGDYLDVMDSQRESLTTKRILIQVQGARYISTIQLIKALGGSWCSSNSEPMG